MKRIFETFKRRGVGLFDRDDQGRAPLHYAVYNKSIVLVRLLLESGANASEIDKKGDTPLTIYLGHSSTPSDFQIYNPGLGTWDIIFKELADKGADMNHVFPASGMFFEPSFAGSLKSHLIDPDSYDSKTYRCTVLIKMIKISGCCSSSEKTLETLKNNMMGLFHYGARLNVLDTEKRDSLFYAVGNNNEELVSFIIKNAKQAEQVMNLQDVTGKSHVHAAVMPCDALPISYENPRMIELLYNAGFSLNL